MKRTLAAIAAALLPALVAAQTAPKELSLLCTEQPMTEAVVDLSGRVSTREAPARELRPVEITVGNNDYLTGGRVVSARIDSSSSDLYAGYATWTADESVDADQGRIHIDLRSHMVFVTEPVSGKEVVFRRFQCEAPRREDGAGATVRYRCDQGYDIEVTFSRETGPDGSAHVRYPGGEVRLPHLPSGSGARYAKDDTELWTNDDEALFNLFGGEPNRCWAVR